MQRALLSLTAACLVPAAWCATLAPVSAPVIPVAFEENRGQAPAQFSHLITHYGWGFSCGAISRNIRELISTRVSSASLVGAAPTCPASLDAPAGSFSHYYGGNGDSSLRVPFVPRYDNLSFSQPLPGVTSTYSRLGPAGAAGSGFWVHLALDSPARLPAVRLAFSDGYVSTDGQAITSMLGTWAVTAAQGATLPVKVDVDSSLNSAGFSVPGANAGMPLDIWLDVPLMVATVTGNEAVDAEGNRFVLATTDPNARLDPQPGICNPKSFEICSDVYVAGITAAGMVRSLTYFGGMNRETPYVIRLDPGGNVYVAGTTESADFFSGARLGPTAAGYHNSDLFVLKIHGPTGALINAVALGGSAPDRLYDMAIDGSGNATLTVLTHSPDFPAAGTGLFGTHCAANSVVECPWLVKIDPYKGTFLYSFVIPGNHYDDLNSGMPILAVEPNSGTAYLAVSGWIDIPIPSGAAYATRTGQALTVIAADGSRFEAATYVPPDKVVTAMALRPDRSLWLVGQQTASTAQPYVATVDEALSNLNALPAEVPVPDSVVADSTGRLYLAASSWKLSPFNPNQFTLTPTADAPLAAECPNSSALLRLDLSGAIDFATFVPDAGSNGFLLVAGPQGADLEPQYWGSGLVWRVNPDDTTPTLPLAGCAFVPAPAGWESTFSRIGPGTVVVLLGTNIGPAAPIDLPLDSNGRVATNAGGVRILIGGIAAPILSADPRRVTFVVPMAATGQDLGLTVEKDGSAVSSLPLTNSGYGLEILAGQYTPPGAEILNEDGSVNSQTNPARPGSEVRLHLSGAGPTDSPLQDGVLQHPVPEKPLLLSTFLKIGDSFADILDFAQAPNMVSGIMEMRARVPADVPAGDQAQQLDLHTYFNWVEFFQPAKLWVAK